LAELQDEIARERRILKDRFEQEEREKVLRQYQDDLANVRDAANRMKNTTMGGDLVPPPGNSASTAAASRDATTNLTLDTKSVAPENQAKDDLSPGTSSAKDEWEHQKKFEGVRNEALDSLMKMIGLEDVKNKFLSIKSKVDTAIRQNVDMKDERFGAALLGNPGTGTRSLSSMIL
jgi:hypothetical protein